MTLPTPDQALNMPVEELAGYLVMHHKNDGSFHVSNVMNSLDRAQSQPLDRQRKSDYKEVLIEAYSWAWSEGLFIYDPENMNAGWWKVGRRGRKLNEPLDALSLGARDILPKAFLHPLIAEHAAPIFRMGRFDAAVFQAFKQVEIVVKQSSELQLDGAALMKAAFNGQNGPLNTLTEPSERDGLMFVFAGAQQLFRNAPGHKNIEMDPTEAAHLLIHASYLLTLAEKHSELAKQRLSSAD